MGDILKEAIADAKAVRETALENAKMALEEAFTPQLKSMLSAKLKEEDLEEDEIPAEEAYMEGEDDEDEAEEGRHDAEEGMHDDEAEEGMREDDEDDEAEEAMHDEDMDDEEDAEEGMHEEDNLDLEAVIRELEAELSEESVNEEDDAYDEKAAPKRDGLAEEDDAYDEKASPKRDGLAEGDDEDEDDKEEGRGMKEEKDDDDKDEVDEQSDSSKIGTGDNKLDYADSGDEEDPGKGQMHEIKAELAEYKEAVVFLKSKLHEVNILNAKLLFTNKLFKEYSLNNNQKLKVVETFDRAQTTREIKLVYSTLAEQFGDNSTISRKKSISESASSSVGSTKPSEESKKVITEEVQVADRFRKLAGLIK